jgi:hypothetical protein
MWSLATSLNIEVGGFTLENGKVLVTPEYKNTEGKCKIVDYGYSVNKSGKMFDNMGKEFKITGFIHTHQDTKRDASYSYITKEGWGDVGSSRAMGGLPIMTIGHDGMIYGAAYREKLKGYSNISGLGTSKKLLNGSTKLVPWLKTYPLKD